MIIYNKTYDGLVRLRVRVGRVCSFVTGSAAEQDTARFTGDSQETQPHSARHNDCAAAAAENPHGMNLYPAARAAGGVTAPSIARYE